ncbi:MAG: sigma-70 family RNA polymerase sigma factor [Actinomycetota bacterium]
MGIEIDEELVNQLHRRHFRQLVVSAAHRGAADPEGVASEAFLRALQRVDASTADGARIFPAYARSIIRNLVIDEHRHREVVDRRGRLIATPPTAPAQTEDEVSSMAEVMDLIERLTPAQREVIAHYYLDDLATEEVSRRTGRSPAAVRRLRRHGLAQLRETVEVRSVAAILVALLTFALGALAVRGVWRAAGGGQTVAGDDAGALGPGSAIGRPPSGGSSIEPPSSGVEVGPGRRWNGSTVPPVDPDGSPAAVPPGGSTLPSTDEPRPTTTAPTPADTGSAPSADGEGALPSPAPDRQDSSGRAEPAPPPPAGLDPDNPAESADRPGRPSTTTSTTSAASPAPSTAGPLNHDGTPAAPTTVAPDRAVPTVAQTPTAPAPPDQGADDPPGQADAPTTTASRRPVVPPPATQPSITGPAGPGRSPSVAPSAPVEPPTTDAQAGSTPTTAPGPTTGGQPGAQPPRGSTTIDRSGQDDGLVKGLGRPGRDRQPSAGDQVERLRATAAMAAEGPGSPVAGQDETAAPALD